MTYIKTVRSRNPDNSYACPSRARGEGINGVIAHDGPVTEQTQSDAWLVSALGEKMPSLIPEQRRYTVGIPRAADWDPLQRIAEH